MPIKKKEIAVAGAKRGPKVKKDRKKPVQVYLLESEIITLGKHLNPKNKTYTEHLEAVREDVLTYLSNHKGLEP